MPPIDAAKVLQKIRETGDVVEATILADELAADRQAAIAPPPGPDQAMSPEMAPGLGAPGEGREMMAPPEPMQPLDAQTGLSTLTRALRTPTGAR